ncbi:flagellar type III secretion system pore protein FliP [Brucella sp. IR073]|uniref:flagellar type III secretion system pore protein FliP n=1 Tax=unclassified Brucella TaxID=2632610 RepID=UPI003B985BCE
MPGRAEGGERAGTLAKTASTLTLLATFLLLGASAAAAQTQAAPSLQSLLPAGSGTASGQIVQLLGLLTVLSIAPGLLIMVTSFTRFTIAFSMLRSGLGLPTAPANLVMVSLALFMTFYVMAPAFDRAWQNGVQPLMRNEISQEVALREISAPFREFMLRQVRDKDLRLFEDLADPSFRTGEDGVVDLRILVPAFMISELRRGFEIGFLIVLPFLVIDLVVATLTMSMGMMMLPPTVLSLPFKILFFVLIDGWNILVGSLIRSFS